MLFINEWLIAASMYFDQSDDTTIYSKRQGH